MSNGPWWFTHSLAYLLAHWWWLLCVSGEGSRGERYSYNRAHIFFWTRSKSDPDCGNIYPSFSFHFAYASSSSSLEGQTYKVQRDKRRVLHNLFGVGKNNLHSLYLQSSSSGKKTKRIYSSVRQILPTMDCWYLIYRYNFTGSVCLSVSLSVCLFVCLLTRVVQIITAARWLVIMYCTHRSPNELRSKSKTRSVWPSLLGL